tara:strand:+ start:2774 stop:3628 length:855 start_codon:yes stop_codon:yes gene_type:complete
MKLLNYINLYKQHLVSEKNLSENTIKNYLVDLNQFFNDDFLPEEIDQKFEKYISNLRKKSFTHSSINRKVSVIKNFIKFLQIEKIFENINLDKFNSLKNSKKIPKAIPKDQIEIIFNALNSIKSKNTYTFVMVLKLMYLSGLRISEALSLTWSDLNESEFSLNIYGKGSKERKVYFDKSYLKDIIKLKSNSNYIFNINNKKISLRGINKFLETAYKNGIINIHLSTHVFRHSFATSMLENKADIRHIQKLLGHSNISTTEIYTKVAKTMKKNVLESYHPLKNKL